MDKPKQRLPRQARAQKTVADILNSATLLISEHGLEQFSTNKLAEHSGVNIASIYQYFPNKEAIVAAIIEQHVGAAIQVLQSMVNNSDTGQISIKDAAYQLITAGISLFKSSEGLILELLSSMPNFTKIPGMKILEFQMAEACRRFLIKRRDQLKVKDLDTAIYIATNATIFLMVKYLFDPPAHISNEQIAEETATMIAGYFE